MKKIIYLSLSLVFILQAMGIVSIIPVHFVLGFLGLGKSTFSVIFSMFLSIISIFVATFIIEFLYSLGVNKKFLKKFFTEGSAIIAFICIWVTFFTYGILAAIGIFPRLIDEVQFLNYYLFWFFLITGFVSIEAKQSSAVSTNNKRIVDENRVTWFSHVLGINDIKQYMGERGNLVYDRGTKLGYYIIMIFFFPVFSFFMYFVGKVAFGVTSISVNGGQPDAEIVYLIKILAGFFFTLLLVSLMRLIGILFSRNVILYENCIVLDLPTFSDTPLFTLFLPKSRVAIAYDAIEFHHIDVVTHRHKHGGKTQEYYLKLKIKDGDNVKTILNVSDKNEFTQKLDSMINKNRI